jgi:hypothetical protein
MAELIKKIYWLLTVQFGLDARRLARSIKGIPRYAVGWFQFRRLYKGKMNFQPCLYDWYEEGGATKNEYFLLSNTTFTRNDEEPVNPNVNVNL